MVSPDELERIPMEPGVYLMKDKTGRILYVGKASKLRNRVRSYFRGGGDGRLRVPRLVEHTADVDFITTENERDALILESQLVREHQPPYNIDLRDDKTWLSLRLDRRKEWPRLEPVRKWRNDGARYFGPYLLDTHARRVLGTLRAAFPIRNCSDSLFRSHKRLGRPCLEAQMGRCAAPCTGQVGQGDYIELVERVEQVLSGRGKDVSKELEARMWEAADAEQFERAARLRDVIETVMRVPTGSQVKGRKSLDLDVWGLFREGDQGAVAILPVRGGKVLGGRTVPLKNVVADSGELLASMLMQFYGKGDRPKEVLLPEHPVGAHTLEEHLDIRIKVPQRGEKRRFLELAMANARSRHDALADRRAGFVRAARSMQRWFDREEPPRVIECFDNSHLRGDNAYSSMVRFTDGEPDKKGYRLFKLRDDLEGDDYTAMRETLGRRLRRAAAGDKGWALPDVIVIDGGRGQLNMALQAARDEGIPEPERLFCAIAKPDGDEETDKIYLPNRVNAVYPRAHSPVLHLLQHARDEAHRFGISRHRKARRKSLRGSKLDAVPGLGPARRRALLRHFGSLKRVEEATAEQLCEVDGIGPALAEAVVETLAGEAAPAGSER